MSAPFIRPPARWFPVAVFALVLLAGCAVQQPDDTFKFVVFGDSQFHSESTFERIVRETELLKPDFVVHVGDMISGYVYEPENVGRQWVKFKEQIAPLTMPFYPTPGNHDITFAGVESVYAEVWGRQPFYYSFDHKNIHFIVLNAVDPNRPYWLSDEEVAWLRDDLEEHRDAENIFISLHPPLYRNNPDNVAAGRDFDWVPIHTLLTQYPVRAVFTGHSHAYDYRILDGIRYFCLNSSGDMRYSNHLMGWSHHFLVCTVDGPQTNFAVVVPGERIYPPEAVDPGERARTQRWLDPEQTLLIPDPAKGPIDDPVSVTIRNRARETRDYTVHWDTEDYRWSFEPWGVNFSLPPGGERNLTFAVSGPEAEVQRKDLPRLKSESPYVNLRGWATTATNTWALFSPPETTAVRRTGTIALDGQLTETAWDDVPAITRLETDEEGTPAPESTTVKVLYDQEELYVGVVGEEPNPAGLSTYAQGEVPLVFGDDDFELYFDPQRDLRTAYRLMVNPKGTKFNSSPKGLFTVNYDVATHVGEKNWSAEFRIPYDSLNAPAPESETVWGFNVRRNRQQSAPAQWDWSKMRTYPPEPAYFGLLRFE